MCIRQPSLLFPFFRPVIFFLFLFCFRVYLLFLRFPSFGIFYLSPLRPSHKSSHCPLFFSVSQTPPQRKEGCRVVVHLNARKASSKMVLGVASSGNFFQRMYVDPSYTDFEGYKGVNICFFLMRRKFGGGGGGE